MADVTTTVDQTAKIVAGWNDRLTALADALTEAAKTHGQEAVDLAIASARVSAAAGLVEGLGCLAGAAAMGVIIRWCFKRASKEGAKGIHDQNDSIVIGCVAGLILAGITGAVLTVGVFVDFFDLWNWVGMFEPRLLIAHRLLKI